MENFENFEMENLDMVVGAGTTDTTWVDGSGNRGLDKYDDDLDRVIYL
nr:hypothetical protein [Allomuricauda sp.]